MSAFKFMVTLLFVSRLLLPASSISHDADGATTRKPNSKVGTNVGCSNEYIEVFQANVGKLPNGIPTFRVEIMNNCPYGCKISKIHLSCGQFSSAILINPNVFKRLSVGDCLVNRGNPLLAGRVLSFTYATSFMYELSVSSISCLA